MNIIEIKGDWYIILDDSEDLKYTQEIAQEWIIIKKELMENKELQNEKIN